MLRKLCGDKFLQNVVIVTNRWGEVPLQVGEAREAELQTRDIFFKPILDKGARMTRHENTVSSAEKIIRLILPPEAAPKTRGAVQSQMVTFIHLCHGEVILTFP